MFPLTPETNEKCKFLMKPPGNYVFFNGLMLVNLWFGLWEMKCEYLANIFLVLFSSQRII